MWQDNFGCANHRIEKLNLLQYVVETDKDPVIIHNYGKHQLQKKREHEKRSEHEDLKRKRQKSKK